MSDFEDSGSGDKRARRDRVRITLEDLEREVARLKHELKKLKCENDQLKSWPDYGESILADTD